MKKINVVNDETSLDQNFFNTLQSNVEEVFNGEEAMGSIVVEDVIGKNLFNALDGNYDWQTETYHIGSFTKDNENKLTIVNGGDWAKLGCTIGGLEPNTQYTISTNVTNPSGETCGLWTQSYGNVLKTDTTFKATLTLTTNTSGTLTFAFYTNFLGTYKGTTVTFDNIQLEKGSTATEYTEFKKYGYNSQESMGNIVVDDIECKNLFDKNNNIQGGSFTDTGVIDTSSDKFIQLSYIPVESSKNYILHAETVPDRLVICEYDSNKNFIKRNISLGTYTLVIATTSTTKYVRVCSSNSVLDTLQFELGDKATPYTPYKEFSTTKRNLYNDSLLNSNYCGGSTNLKEMYLYNNGLVVINFSVTLNNTITANTSTQLVTIPSELLPSKNVSLMTVNINKEGKEIAYINSGEGKIRWRSSVNAVAGDEIYIQGTYVKDEGLSTSTQSASMMYSPRPTTPEDETTPEEGELDG